MVKCTGMRRKNGTALCPVPGREGTQHALGMQVDGVGDPGAREKALRAYGVSQQSQGSTGNKYSLPYSLRRANAAK